MAGQLDPHGDEAGGGGAEHGTDDHGTDDHGHAEAALGPIDVQSWGAAVGGVVLGLLVVLALVQGLS